MANAMKLSPRLVLNKQQECLLQTTLHVCQCFLICIAAWHAHCRSCFHSFAWQFLSRKHTQVTFSQNHMANALKLSPRLVLHKEQGCLIANSYTCVSVLFNLYRSMACTLSKLFLLICLAIPIWEYIMARDFEQ